MTSPAVWPENVSLRRYAVLDSTNEEARRLADAGAQGPLWIAAAQQSAGRGRYGRRWVSQPGNLFATLLIEAVPAESAQLAFVAGVAVADTLSIYVPDGRVKLKWPNDILLAGRKSAGILLERVSPRLIALGIGINLVCAPDDLAAISIAECAATAPDPEEVLSRLGLLMAQWLALWQAQGFAPVRCAWIARAGGIGEPIRAVTPQHRFDGIFENLDTDGALLLREPDGRSHRITAADVFYGA